jgi:excinuclease ABC subunit B
MAPNKTLAAQLYAELREFFPENAVEYFVSYYDYYQPEAYVPSAICSSRRIRASTSTSSRCGCRPPRPAGTAEDAIIVATVSAIYGIGDPVDYHADDPAPARGRALDQRDIMRRLTEMQYERNELEFKRGVFRVQGRRDRHLPGRSAETGACACRCSTTRSNRCRCSIR